MSCHRQVIEKVGRRAIHSKGKGKGKVEGERGSERKRPRGPPHPSMRRGVEKPWRRKLMWIKVEERYDKEVEKDERGREIKES